jgi:hypothetical protein
MKRWKPIQWLMGVAAGICSGCYRAGRRDAHDGDWTESSWLDATSLWWERRRRAESRGKTRDSSSARSARPGPLVTAQDHGVDHIDAACNGRPEQRRKEKAANDIAYGMGRKEAWCGASMGSEIFELRLQSWERWCLHCHTSIGREQRRTRGGWEKIPQRR